MLAPDATMPIARPFFALNQVATTRTISLALLRSSSNWIRTLRGRDKEARHAQASDEPLGKPCEPVSPLVAYIHYSGEERTQGNENGADDDEHSAVAGIEETAHYRRECQDHEAFSRA